MISLTENEKKILLILFKEFNIYYNANSISKKVDISRVGCMKILKKLERKKYLISKIIGKSVIYKLNLEEDYVRDLITFLLSDEANNFKRWKDEFKEIYKKERIVILYGSAIRDYSKAKDIDIMIIRRKGESGEIHKLISERQKFISKRVHAIDLTSEEFTNNLKQKRKAIVDIIKNSIILYGQNKYVELIKNVTNI